MQSGLVNLLRRVYSMAECFCGTLLALIVSCLLDCWVHVPALAEDSDPPKADAIGREFGDGVLSVGGAVSLSTTADCFSLSAADLVGLSPARSAITRTAKYDRCHECPSESFTWN
jgi:hypothetical protein